MYWLFLLQAFVPAALIGTLACFPLRTAAAFLLQVLAALLTTAALVLVGMWTLPPWWYPYGWLLVGIAVAAWHWGKRPERPAGAISTSGLALASAGFLLLALGASWQLALAVQGRNPRQLEIVDLAFPLEAGRYLIVNGGSTAALNAHLRTLDPEFPGFPRWRGQSFAVDIVAIDALGLRASGIQPREPRAYRSYGLKVLAPCAGTVMHASDDLPDQPVPEVDRENMTGNYVQLRCANHEVVLGHLQQGSVQVEAGQQVTAGEHLAAVGNTGNSDEPHLHIHAQTTGSALEPMAGTPLQMTLAGRFLLRNQRISIP